MRVCACVFLCACVWCYPFTLFLSVDGALSTSPLQQLRSALVHSPRIHTPRLDSLPPTNFAEITPWHPKKFFEFYFGSMFYVVKLLYNVLIIVIPIGLQAGVWCVFVCLRCAGMSWCVCAVFAHAGDCIYLVCVAGRMYPLHVYPFLFMPIPCMHICICICISSSI